MAEMSAEDFIQKIIIESFDAAICVGHDFHFGKIVRAPQYVKNRWREIWF